MNVLGHDSIVVINTCPLRCDAILVNRTIGMKLVELTTLEFHDLVDQVLRLSASRPFISLSLLEWLWDNVASHVLDGLGLHKSYEDYQTRPRLFWILTGSLTYLPIHAAGRHLQGSKETVLDRAMSSYCSSLRAFVNSRKDLAKVDINSEEVNKALLVAMPITPDHKKLEFTTKETHVVRDTCSLLQLKPLQLTNQTRAAVLAELDNAYIFHFAGHAQLHPLDPSQSGMLLDDGPLTVADIRDRVKSDRLPFLAYLSACLTAANDVPKLADEAIHHLAACQLAGFRHTIGSLWQLHDDACVGIAEAFYCNLATSGMTDYSVCAALHDACVHSRDDWVAKVFPKATSSNIHSASFKVFEVDGSRLHGESAYQEGERHSRINLGDSTTKGLVRADWVPYVHYGP